MDPVMSLNEVRFDVMKIQNKMLGFTVSVGLLPLISIVSSKGTVLGGESQRLFGSIFISTFDCSLTMY